MIVWRPRETRDNLFHSADNQYTIVVYDLETTGLDPKTSSVIQISAQKLKYNGTTFEEVDSLNQYINPEIPIPRKITEITGITDEMVVGEPTESEIFPTIREFFGVDFVISGYNVAKFDNKFMENMYARYNETFSPKFTIDVIDMARDTVDSKETENFKLATIFALYNTDTDIQFHNAFDDVKATSRLLTQFYNEYKDSYDKDEGLIPEEGKIQIASVSRIAFWEGFKGFSRIYITTNIGEFYLDVRRKLWNVQKGNPYDINEIDMCQFRQLVFKKAEVQNEDELIKKYTPRSQKVCLVPTVVNSLRRWEKVTDKGKEMKRIYISTDVGNFFYDIIYNRWVSNTNSPNETVDVDVLKTLVFEKAGVTNEIELTTISL